MTMKAVSRWLGSALLALVTVGGVGYLLTYEPTAHIEVSSVADTQASSEREVVMEEPESQAAPVEPEERAVFDPLELQDAVDSWANNLSGRASVVVMGVDGSLFASHDDTEIYFGASIYKLYAAYFGYQQIDAGDVVADELYVGQSTRSECLDAMIRTSDSPCAEQLRAEIGPDELNTLLAQIGISESDMTTLNTTASDAAAMMARFAASEGLSEESQVAFLSSAKDQIYRDALNAGFSTNATVYNKIGFRDFDEYHDVALVELEDGRRFILSVLTDGVGTRAIAALAEQIESLVL